MEQKYKTSDEILDMLEECPKHMSKWRHVKTGNLYLVYNRAVNKATLEPMVLYCAFPDSMFFWVRPLSSWKEKFIKVED